MRKKFGLSILLILSVFILVFVTVGILLSRDFECYEKTLILRENGSALRIAHISDYHIPKNAVAADTIIQEVKNRTPDLIFLTGDMFDGSAELRDVLALREFLCALTKQAPTFAVIGNHEIGSAFLLEYESLLHETGVTLLNNQTVHLLHAGRTVSVTGLKDGMRYTAENVPSAAVLEKNTVKLLLAHRPELFPQYASTDEDMRPSVIFSGHAHGGQVRLFGRGLIAPNQGLFPAYTEGVYEMNHTFMAVSRGLGDSISSLRLYNNYQLVFITLII